MNTESSQLIHIQIANPCHASWEAMQGDAVVRNCQSCRKNVYNISEMNRVAAEKLIRENEGNLCVRFYQRADGTIITDDCPVGLKIVKRPLQWLSAIGAAVAAFAFALIPGAARANPAPGLATAPKSGSVNSRSHTPRVIVMGKMPQSPHKKPIGHFITGRVGRPPQKTVTVMGSPPALGPKPTPAPPHKPVASVTMGEVAPVHQPPVQIMGLIAVSPTASASALPKAIHSEQ